MKKNILKISLDIVMAVILVLLYNSHAISLAFHEISGLFLFGLFTIHCLLNKKWIASITGKFFSKSLAPRVRFGYIIDLLLLISFILIIISGISTSQVLFASIAQGKDSPWRSVHHFFAALSIILVGIHLGLHWSFVTGMFKKIIRIPPKLVKPLSISLLVIVFAFGSYSIKASGFTGWLTEPFLSTNESTSPDSGTKSEDKSSWDGIVNGDKPGESSTKTEEVNPSASDSSDTSVTSAPKVEDKSSWDGTVNGDKPGESDTKTEENGSSASSTNDASVTDTPKVEDKSSWDGTVNGDKPGESDIKAETDSPTNTNANDAPVTETPKVEDKSSWDGTINGDKPGESDTKTEEDSSSATNADDASVTDAPKVEDKSSWDGTVNGDKPDEIDTKTEENSTETGLKEVSAVNDQAEKSGENKNGTAEEPTQAEASSQTSGDTSEHPAGEKKTEEGSPIAIVGTIATYLSILGLFTAITYYIDKFLKNKKRAGGKTN